MNIVLLGSHGFVAKHILASNKTILPYNKRFYNDTDITYFVRELKAQNADVVINCIGATGNPNIDSLENDKQKTFFTNTIIPIALASACDKFGIHFIQLSSGCCYYGLSPAVPYWMHEIGYLLDGHTDPGWKETNFGNPQSTYSRSKYASDIVLEKLSSVCTLRLRMPVSCDHSQRNLITKLIGYPKVLEEPNSVTFIDDLVRAVQWVIDNKKTGIYHVALPKPLTHSVFLEEYKKYVPSHTYEKIDTKQLDALTTAPRSNCILNVDKIQKEGFVFEDTSKAVIRYVKEFVDRFTIKE